MALLFIKVSCFIFLNIAHRVQINELFELSLNCMGGKKTRRVIPCHTDNLSINIYTNYKADNVAKFFRNYEQNCKEKMTYSFIYE